MHRHIRGVRTREADAEDERKRKHVRISMRNLLRYEQELSASESSTEEDKEKAAADKKKKEADAKKLFQLIFDDVENGPVTKIGIAVDEADFVEIKRMLGERAHSELRSAIDR